MFYKKRGYLIYSYASVFILRKNPNSNAFSYWCILMLKRQIMNVIIIYNYQDTTSTKMLGLNPLYSLYLDVEVILQHHNHIDLFFLESIFWSVFQKWNLCYEKEWKKHTNCIYDICYIWMVEVSSRPIIKWMKK